jgi:hypothetical protein
MIILAIDPSDLSAWAKLVATDLAEVYKAEREKKEKQKASSSWTSYFFGSTTV